MTKLSRSRAMIEIGIYLFAIQESTSSAGVVRRFGKFDLSFEDAGFVGRAGGQGLFGLGHFNGNAFVRRARFAIDDIDDYLAVPVGLLDHRQVGDDGDRISYASLR